MKNTKKLTLNQICIYSILIYFVIAITFRFVVDDELKYNSISTPMVSSEMPLGEIFAEDIIEQIFFAETDAIDSVSFYVGTYSRVNEGDLIVGLLNREGIVLSESKVELSSLKDNTNHTIKFENLITGVKGEELKLQIEAPNSRQDNAITIYYNSNNFNDRRELRVNNEIIQGELCFSVNGKEEAFFGTYYWCFVFTGVLLLIIYCLIVILKEKQGKQSLVVSLYKTFVQYNFLLKQLVSRDFKTKYKRSVLGFLWSFLNPLLTMLIQYIVFSTIFRSNIDNFPVYLLSGSILFTFFSESISVGLLSVAWNSSLITKVYVPKYIFPLSKVLSTSINLLISMIPLFLTAVITGEAITKAYLMLPYAIICLIIFCVGMSLVLSSAMIFFRDTQFLWGLASMLWMYATPLFYPESIIPERFSFIIKANPMYYFIKFVRIIFLEGISPQPIMYLQCFFWAVLSLVIGIIVFKKSQDKFILYI